MTVSLSPVDLSWEAGGKRLSLRQADRALVGDLPLALLPFFEEDTQTWGVAWSSGNQPHTLTLQATRDGHAHLLTLQGGAVYVHALPLVRGERFEFEVDPARPPAAVVREDGRRIEADVIREPGGRVTPPRAAAAPAANADLAAAECEFQAAYEDYTRLITGGGAGSVEQALARYKAAHARLNRLKAGAEAHR